MTFTTSPPPPTAVTNSASLVSASGATLNGTVNAESSSTTVTFEYGPSDSYGTTVTADQSPVTGSTDTAVSKAISGLTPSATYHYRVIATNGNGTTYGADTTFVAITKYSGGYGTAGSPWQISSLSDLQYLMDNSSDWGGVL